jgi:hypothetical protein
MKIENWSALIVFSPLVSPHWPCFAFKDEQPWRSRGECTISKLPALAGMPNSENAYNAMKNRLAI